jgi:hypothetical protein
MTFFYSQIDMQLNLVQDIQQGAQKSKKRKRKTEVQASHTTEGKDRLRIEHLNYKANIILFRAPGAI